MKHKLLTNMIIVLLGLLILSLLYFIAVNTIFAKSVLPNVYLNDEDISMLSESQLKDKMKAELLDKLPTQIVVKVDQNSVTIPVSELNLNIDTYKMLNYGKGSDLLKVITQGLGLLRGERAEVSYSIDPNVVVSSLPINLKSDNPSGFTKDNFLDCKYNQYNFTVDGSKLSNLIVDALKDNKEVNLNISDILTTK